MKLENKQIGVLIALVLAVIMLLLPSPDKSKYSFDPIQLAEAIQNGDDSISPQTLSEWIIDGNNDFRLIDIRTAAEYERGSIQGAENIPLDRLLLKKTLENELNDDKIYILFSNGNSLAAQAWLVLNSLGKSCYMLEGGYNYWIKSILNPSLSSAEPSDDEILRYKAAKAVSEYFGGQAAAGGGEITPVKKKPTKKIIRKKKKKKLGGC